MDIDKEITLALARIIEWVDIKYTNPHKLNKRIYQLSEYRMVEIDTSERKIKLYYQEAEQLLNKYK